MYLYHGSDVEVNEIDINKCRGIADFGKGFYATNNKEQAIIWAKRKAIEKKGFLYTPDIRAVVSVFDFDGAGFKNSKAKFRRFHGISAAWDKFVKNNIKNSNRPEGDHNLDLRYDLVIGRAATLDTYVLIAQYESGQIDKADFKEALKSVSTCNQYSFHTLESIKHLKFIEHKYYDITEEEFNNFYNTRNCYVITSYSYNGQRSISRHKLPLKLNGI